MPAAFEKSKAPKPILRRRPISVAAVKSPAAPKTQPDLVAFAQGHRIKLAARNFGIDDLSVGQRVFHGKFGYGTIEAIEGNKLEIEFEKAGRKRVLDSFVSLP